jgi:hypothetical protein
MMCSAEPALHAIDAALDKRTTACHHRAVLGGWDTLSYHFQNLRSSAARLSMLSSAVFVSILVGKELLRVDRLYVGGCEPVIS